LPRQIWLSGTWQFYQGFPDTTTVSVGNNTVALTQGTQTLTVEERGTTRLPSVSSLDVSLRKTFRINGKSLEPRIDFYNLTNNAAILGQITQLGPTYLRVSNIQRGRLIKVGLSVEF
jgi:outer membrane receptor protein involved in Fe transport